MVEIWSLVSILENVFSDKMGVFENTVSRFCTEERTVFSDKMEVQGFEDAWLKIRSLVLYWRTYFQTKLGFKALKMAEN